MGKLGRGGARGRWGGGVGNERNNFTKNQANLDLEVQFRNNLSRKDTLPTCQNSPEREPALGKAIIHTHERPHDLLQMEEACLLACFSTTLPVFNIYTFIVIIK